MGWSKKYKKSIDCNNPKGFSQKAHCAGRKKREGTMSLKLEELVGKKLTEEQFDEAAGEKDACYRKVKARYDVWPSAYASGALVKCRKVGAKNWGNKSKKEGVDEAKYKGYDYKRQKRKDGLSLIVPALRKSFSNMKDLKKYIDKHGKMEGVNEDIDSQIDSLMKQKKRLMDKRPVPTQQVARISGKLNVLRAKKAKEKERKEGVNEGKFRVHFDLNPDASPAERLGLMSVEVKAKNKKEAEKMVADKFVGGMLSLIHI